MTRRSGKLLSRHTHTRIRRFSQEYKKEKKKKDSSKFSTLPFYYSPPPPFLLFPLRTRPIFLLLSEIQTLFKGGVTVYPTHENVLTPPLFLLFLISLSRFIDLFSFGPNWPLSFQSGPFPNIFYFFPQSLFFIRFIRK